jgi:hypothetical protein
MFDGVMFLVLKIMINQHTPTHNMYTNMSMEHNPQSDNRDGLHNNSCVKLTSSK